MRFKREVLNFMLIFTMFNFLLWNFSNKYYKKWCFFLKELVYRGNYYILYLRKFKMSFPGPLSDLKSFDGSFLLNIKKRIATESTFRVQIQIKLYAATNNSCHFCGNWQKSFWQNCREKYNFLRMFVTFTSTQYSKGKVSCLMF